MPPSKNKAVLKEIKITYKRVNSKNKAAGASITGPKKVVSLFRDLQDEAKEKFITVNLDSQNKILCFEVVAIGSVDSIYLRPMEIFRTSVAVNAYAAIVLHNHPSGDSKPSRQDKKLTKDLFKLATTMGLKLFDHIVIGYKEYFSFAESGALPNFSKKTY